jgi:hypothetical protein
VSPVDAASVAAAMQEDVKEREKQIKTTKLKIPVVPVKINKK